MSMPLKMPTSKIQLDLLLQYDLIGLSGKELSTIIRSLKRCKENDLAEKILQLRFNVLEGFTEQAKQNLK